MELESELEFHPNLAFEVAYSVISRLLKRHIDSETVDERERSGRPRKTSARDDRALSYGQNLSDEKQLFVDVFANHQKEVIPHLNHSTPLQIQMTFYLMSITKFEEIDETIVVLGGLHCDWNDAGISWNPSSYGNIPYIILSSKHIWKPPMTLVNAVDILSPIEGNTDNLATIFSDGNVSLGLGGILSAKCTTDISKFPYDSQTCNLKFAVWGLSAETAVLIESSDPINMLFYTPNSNWNLTSYHSRAVIWNQEDKKKMNAFWKLIGSRLPWTRKDNIVTVVPITDEKPAICKTSSPHGNVNWKDLKFVNDWKYTLLTTKQKCSRADISSKCQRCLFG
ncbi:unnamed protein product [Mytilus edulis]|uniref:Neurotransmitter-gated ion-channel ligand-binding domain-containing protein n=1 Tax=Mytilus edulis TaxID=6550 RepID=A0A8S3QRG5_MYTED|nr:unnamed protein product [Mytilus edulis]